MVGDIRTGRQKLETGVKTDTRYVGLSELGPCLVN